MTLRRVLLCFTWVTLLVSPGAVEAQGRSAALQEVLDHTPIIAIGQVERMDVRGGRELATFRVERVARGELPDVITLDITPPPGEHTPAVGLSRTLVFLEPPSEQTPHFRVTAGGAAALKIFSYQAKASALFLNDARWAHLCGPHSTKSGCHARLDTFLRDAKLRPFTPRPQAVFRVLQPRQCGPCDLDEQVGKRLASGSRDCGMTPAWSPAPRVLRCVRESLTAQTPFHVRVQRGGVDSRLVDAYVSDGSRFLQLAFDSSTTGGSQCAARVSQQRCSSLVLTSGQEEPLRCERPEGNDVLCEQNRFGYALGPAEKASRLTCFPQVSKNAWRCEVGSNGTPRGGRTPRPDGPDFLCTQRERDLMCYEQ